MSDWKRVGDYVTHYTKGITPNYVPSSSIMVLNQKCVRKNRIDYSYAQFTDDSKSYPKNKFVQEGDILVNSTGQGTAGRCAFVDKLPEGIKVITDSHMLLLRCSTYHEAQCLNYYLYSFERKIQSFMDGSTGQAELDKTRLFDIFVSIPSDPDIQKTIASFLYAIDSKFVVNDRIISQLQDLAKTLYFYWFVQFDFPNDEGKPYKTSGGKMVWNKELKREIPDGWQVKKLRRVINIVRGASPRPIDDYLSTTGTPWVKISDATSSDNRFITETRQFIREEGVSKSRFVTPDTLILTNSATPGIPRIMKIDACVHDGWLIIDGYTHGLSQEFMFHYFDYERLRITVLGNGSIFKNLKTDYIKDLEIVLPPEPLLKCLTPLLKEISNDVFIKTKENQELSELRKWLIPMLMNGQMAVNKIASLLDDSLLTSNHGGRLTIPV